MKDKTGKRQQVIDDLMYIVFKGTITVTNPDNNACDKKLAFEIMHHLFLAFQKLIVHFLKMPEIQILQCLCKICLNTAKIIQKQQKVFGITKEMNKIVLQVVQTTA